MRRGEEAALVNNLFLGKRSAKRLRLEKRSRLMKTWVPGVTEEEEGGGQRGEGRAIINVSMAGSGCSTKKLGRLFLISFNHFLRSFVVHPPSPRLASPRQCRPRSSPEAGRPSECRTRGSRGRVGPVNHNKFNEHRTGSLCCPCHATSLESRSLHLLFLLLAPPSTLDLPSVLLDHVGQLDDVLALLVLLAGLERLLVLPAQRGLAAVTVDVRHRMQPRQQDTLLRGAAPDIHHRVEQVGATLASLKK